MVFDGTLFPQQIGEILSRDRFREVELGLAFRKMTCSRCGFSSFYKFKTHQVRRTPELAPTAEDDVRPDHVDIWKTVPRFAEIAETLHCKRCREVLGVYTYCIF